MLLFVVLVKIIFFSISKQTINKNKIRYGNENENRKVNGSGSGNGNGNGNENRYIYSNKYRSIYRFRDKCVSICINRYRKRCRN